jgi:hypothetical protein
MKQISVFLENTKGRLAEVTGILGRSGINLRALTVADTADFGIVRMVVNDPKHARAVLEDAGFTVKETEVIGVEVEDRPGGLAAAFDLFAARGVNIEYVYTSLENSKNKAVVVFKVENLEHTLAIIKENGIPTVSGF